MTKKLIILIITLSMLATVTHALAADTTGQQRHDAVFWVGKTTYLVDGAAKTFDVTPYVENDRTYVPVRYLAEMLGLQAAWDEKTQTVTLTGQKTIKLVIDQPTMKVDSQAVKMDVAPQLRNGRTMLPARWIAEAMGYGVDWMDKLEMFQVWPLELVGGKWRVPPVNIRPAINGVKVYWDKTRAVVDTTAGQYTFEDGFTAPFVNHSGQRYLPFNQLLQYCGFPVKYNIDYSNNGDTMTIWGKGWFGPMRVQIAIGTDKMLRSTWDTPLDVPFGPAQGITNPYRGPNGEFMISENMVGLKDYLFNKGSLGDVANSRRYVIGSDFYFNRDAM